MHEFYYLLTFLYINFRFNFITNHSKLIFKFMYIKIYKFYILFVYISPYLKMFNFYFFDFYQPL